MNKLKIQTLSTPRVMALMAIVALAPAAQAGTVYRWGSATAGGEWTTATNWLAYDGSAWITASDYPRVQGDTADFSLATTAFGMTVATDITVGTIYASSSTVGAGLRGELSGPGKVTFDNGASAPVIQWTTNGSAAVKLSAPMQLNGDLTIKHQNDGHHQITGTITGVGGLDLNMPSARGNQTGQPEYTWTIGGSASNTYDGGTLISMAQNTNDRYSQLILAKDGATGTGVVEMSSTNRAGLRITANATPGTENRIDNSAALKLVKIPNLTQRNGSDILTLQLDAGVNETVGSLHFWQSAAWVQVPAGTWGSSSSGATYINDTYFGSSTGILTVATGITPPIATWAGATSTDWSVAANWSGSGTLPPNEAFAQATFGNTLSNPVVDLLDTDNPGLGKDATVGQISFAGQVATTIQSTGTSPQGKLILDNIEGSPARVTVNHGAAGAHPDTISAPVTLNAPMYIKVADSTDQLTLSGAIGGTSGLVVVSDNLGTVLLSNTNTYTGATSVTAGTLSLTGSLAGSNVSTSGTGVISQSAAGVIGGSGVTFTQGSSGTSTLSGANTYTGVTSVTAGTLSLTGSLAGSNVSTSGTGVISQSAAGVIGGAGKTFTQGSSGTSTLSGANTYTGTTTISAGVLRADNNVGLPGTSSSGGGSYLNLAGGVFETGANLERAGGTGPGQMKISSGTSGFSAYGAPVQVAFGTIATPEALTWAAGNFLPTTFVLNAATANNTIDFKNAISFANAARTVQVNANVATLSGVLSSSGASGGLTKTGAGTLVLSNANTYIGATSVTAGTLSLTGSLTGSNVSTSVTGVISQSAAGVIGGSGITFTQGSSGTSTLSGTNTYTGITTVSAGTLEVSSPGNLGSSTSVDSALTIGSATVRLLNDSSTNFAKSVKVNNNAGIYVDRAGASASGNTHTLGALWINGSWTLTITGANDYGLTFGAAKSDNATAGITNNAPGLLALASYASTRNGTSTTTIRGSGNTTITGAVTQNGANAMSIIKNDAGTLTLNGTNTYTGATTVSTGKLLLGQGGSMDATAVSVTGTATYGTAFTSSGNTVQGGKTLSLASGTTLDLRDGNTNTLGFTTTANPLSGANLYFDLGTSLGANDQLALTGAATLTNTNTLYFAATGATITNGVYTIITAGSGLDGGTLTLGTTTLLGHTLSITSTPRTATAIYLEVTGGVSGYASWATTNGLSANPSDDSNNDGVANGVAYFMNKTGLATNPGINSSGQVTWPNGGNIPNSEYGADKQFVVQTSSDLQTWSDVLKTDPNLILIDPVVSPPTDGSVSYTLTGTSPRFVRLKVTPN